MESSSCSALRGGCTCAPSAPHVLPVQGRSLPPKALLSSQGNTSEAVTVCSRDAQGEGEFSVCWIPSPTTGRIQAGICAWNNLFSSPLSPQGWDAWSRGSLAHRMQGKTALPRKEVYKALGQRVAWGCWEADRTRRISCTRRPASSALRPCHQSSGPKWPGRQLIYFSRSTCNREREKHVRVAKAKIRKVKDHVQELADFRGRTWVQTVGSAPALFFIHKRGCLFSSFLFNT